MVDWGFKKVEYWKDGFFIVILNVGNDIMFLVYEFESYDVVFFFFISCFRVKFFIFCWLSKDGNVIYLDGVKL